MRRIPLVLAVAVLLSACSQSATEPSVVGFTVTLALNSSSVASGQPLGWTLTVANAGNVAGRLDFSSGCQANFLVRNGGGEVWNDKWVTACTGALTYVDLGPGESKQYRGSWRQQTSTGAALPGSYAAEGELLTSPPVSSSAVTFAIRR